MRASRQDTALDMPRLRETDLVSRRRRPASPLELTGSGLAAVFRIILCRGIEHALAFRVDVDRRGLQRGVTEDALNHVNGHVPGNRPGTEGVSERVRRGRE